MKSRIIRPLLLTVLLLNSLNVSAQSFKVDNICYNVLSEQDKTCEVTYNWDYGYGAKVEIPEKVVYNGESYNVIRIGDAVFRYGLLDTITIPNSIKSIGWEAFAYCYDLYDISLPESVVEIGENAFYETGWYREQTEDILYLDNCCLGYKSVVVPDKLVIRENTRVIADNAFWGCENVITLVLPNTLTHIGNEAFYFCHGLKSLDLPDSVVSIGEASFVGCYNLTKIKFSNSLENISSGAFVSCKKITSIEIPESVTSIGDEAFSGCASLVKITFPNSVESIGVSAFSECYNLTSITIPESVKTIGNKIFYFNQKLSTIIVEEGNTVYDSRDNCNGIIETATNTLVVANINTIIPNTVKIIGSFAYGGCDEITSVIIPESVTEIEDAAFTDCWKLTTVSIGSNVEKIGDWAFTDIRSLEELECKNPVPPTFGGNHNFSGVNKENVYVYVPEQSVSLYQTANIWKDFPNIIGVDYSSIEEITGNKSDDIEYYNLQGIKVNNPQKGIYIKRKNNKTTKVKM